MIRVSILTYFIAMSLLSGCGRPPSPTTASESGIDPAQARKLSDAIVEDLLDDRREDLHSKMERGMRDYYDKKSFDSSVDQIFATYGKPLEAEYKADDVGTKTYLGSETKPLRKFWYAVRTTKYERGSHFLTVEVVPDEGSLASSGFAILTFPLGVVPPHLR